MSLNRCLKAYSLYEDMPKVKVHPNIINLNALLSALDIGIRWLR
jgi:hypothetical protein